MSFSPRAFARRHHIRAILFCSLGRSVSRRSRRSSHMARRWRGHVFTICRHHCIGLQPIGWLGPRIQLYFVQMNGHRFCPTGTLDNDINGRWRRDHQERPAILSYPLVLSAPIFAWVEVIDPLPDFIAIRPYFDEVIPFVSLSRCPRSGAGRSHPRTISPRERPQ